MNQNRSFPFLRWFSIVLIFVALVLTILQLVSYSRIRANFPRGLTAAGVPIGGLDRQQAAERMLQAYAYQVEVHYGNAIIQIKPSAAGFELDLETMLGAADLQRVNQPFWEGFWDYLWNRTQAVTPVPLRSTISEERLRNYLMTEIAARYDQPPSPAAPIPGTVNFQPGQPGTTLDIDRAVAIIAEALRSPNSRVANLTYSKSTTPRPSLQNLQILMQQIIELSQFKGLVEVYLEDLQTNQVIHFTYQSGQKTSIPVNIAFSGWSTIKIPVMVSAFRRLGDPPSPDAIQLMERMIERSDNDSTDRLAASVIDKTMAPVLVTEDMQTLGLINTFWGGFFYPGAPLLKRYETPANLRTDVDTGPDPYDQATASELGMLLGAINWAVVHS
jgi:beta-lactamase class A